MIQLQDHNELSGTVCSSGQWLVRRSAALPDGSCCNEAERFGAVKYRRGRNDNMAPQGQYLLHAAGIIVLILFYDGCVTLIFGYEGPFHLFDHSNIVVDKGTILVGFW
jgi:hypothetical protein